MPEELYKHNDNINYLLKRKLSFMLRYGMSFLFLLGFAVIASLYFIKAPDTLEGKFVLSSSNPPKSLLAKVNGRIIKINVSDLSKVKAGEVLMVLESVADANGIFALEDSLQFVQALIDSNCLDSLSYIETYNQPYLGEIQQTYEQFKKSNNELYLALTSGQYLQEKSIINNRLHNLHQTRNNLLNQKYIYEYCTAGSIQRNINMAIFRNLQIPIPKSEQKIKERLIDIFKKYSVDLNLYKA
jgi:HlyD family secretion protein